MPTVEPPGEEFDPELRRPLGEIARPLRRLRWGAVICAIDLSVDRFDLLHDAVGVILIASAVFPLAAFADTPRYKIPMRAVAAVCVLSFLESLYPSATSARPGAGTFALLVAVAEVAAALAFLRAMRLLAGWHGETEAAQSWEKTGRLAFWIYAVLPLAALALALLTQSSPPPGLIVFAPLLVLVALAPAVHFLLSVSRMIEAADERPPEEPRPDKLDDASSSAR